MPCTLLEGRWIRVQLPLPVTSRVTMLVEWISRLFPLGHSLTPRTTALMGTPLKGRVPLGPTLVPGLVTTALLIPRLLGVRTQSPVLLLHLMSVTKVEWPGLHLSAPMAVGILNPPCPKLTIWHPMWPLLLRRWMATPLAPPWLVRPPPDLSRSCLGLIPDSMSQLAIATLW